MIQETKKFLSEVKDSSIKTGDKFTLNNDIGKFVKGDNIEIIDILPSEDENEIEVVMSNGKDKDSFFFDKNDNFNEIF